MSGYNVGVVGFLTFVGNWAGAIWWVGAGMGMLGQVKDGKEGRVMREGGEKEKEKRGEDEDEGQQVQSRNDAPSNHHHRHHHEDGPLALDFSSKDVTSPSIDSSPWFIHITILTSFTALSVLSTQIACTMLRNHLFIWTVFSPKYLFVAAWSVGMHLGVNILGGGVGWWVAGGVKWGDEGKEGKG